MLNYQRVAPDSLYQICALQTSKESGFAWQAKSPDVSKTSGVESLGSLLHFTNVSTCYLVKRLPLERLEKSVSHDTRRHNGPGKIRKKINRTAATSISSAPLTMCMFSSTASACDASDPIDSKVPGYPQHPNWDSGVNDLGQHVPRSRGHWMPLLHRLNRMAKRTLTWLVAWMFHSKCGAQNTWG